MVKHETFLRKICIGLFRHIGQTDEFLFWMLIYKGNLHKKLNLVSEIAENNKVLYSNHEPNLLFLT